MIRWSRRTLWLGSFLALLLAASSVDGKKQASPEPSPAKTKLRDTEPEIEEVTAKQLERVLNEKDFVAVFWCECLTGSLANPFHNCAEWDRHEKQ